MLLVTGPVTRNMELALRKTYDAMPAPRLVVAVGACGCSGGIFGRNYATVGAVDAVLPVDVYIPGCPPNPHALLHGFWWPLAAFLPPPNRPIPRLKPDLRNGISALAECDRPRPQQRGVNGRLENVP